MSNIFGSTVIKLSYDGTNFIINGNSYSAPLTISNSLYGDPNMPLHVVLTSDITISDSNTFIILGSDNIILDGQGHTIIVNNVSDYQGLLHNSSNYQGNVVENLNFVGLGTTSIGGAYGAVSTDFNGLVDHVSSSIAISGIGAGGLVGSLLSTGQITNSYTTGAISGQEAGGIVGFGNAGVVVSSYSTGAISGNSAGGIAGEFNDAPILNSYSTGAISGSNAGGIAGYANNGVIANSYSTGAISGIHAGGIAGLANNGAITNSYSTGVVSSSSAGGIADISNNGAITNSNSTPTGWSDATANTTLNGVNYTWIDPSSNTTTPYTLASHPGAYTIVGTVNDNNPWVGNTLQIRITDVTLNGGDSFYADQAERYGFNNGGNNPVGAPAYQGFMATYQWYANGVAINGATSSTLHMSGAYLGKAITAHVSYINGLGLPGTGYVESGSANINGVFDTAANVSTYLDAIEANHTAISAALSTTGSFHILDGASVAVTGTMNQLRTDTHAVALINAGGYKLAVADISQEIRAFFVGNTYAGLNNFWSKFTDLVVTDSSPIRMDLNQLVNTANTFGQLAGNYTLNLTTTVNASDFTSAAVNSHLVSVAVIDSAANYVSAISNLVAHASQASSITLTDNAAVTLTGAQAAALAAAFTGGSDFHAAGHRNAANILYNAASDGTLYIKVSGSGLGTLAAGSSVLFDDQFVSTSGLASSGTTVFFHSNGGINGLTLPDLFTGPSSLGLKYQLIETADNAVVTGSTGNEFIKVASSNSIGKAVDGNGGNDVIDGGVGSTFVTGGAGHNDTFFLDGRAPGVSWSTITDFKAGSDKATIWGFVKGVSSIDASFTNYNNEGAGGYQGLTLHFKNLLPDGQTAGSNPSLNSITLSGHTLAEFGASSLADLNNQINNGSNAHFIVGATNDSLGTHGYLQVV